MWEGTVSNKNIYSKKCWRKTNRKIKKKKCGRRMWRNEKEKIRGMQNKKITGKIEGRGACIILSEAPMRCVEKSESLKKAEGKGFKIST